MISKISFCPSTEIPTQYPHLALFLSLYFFSIHCLFSKWSGSIRAPSRRVSVCDDKCKLYSSPKEITGHSKEINVPLKETEALLIWEDRKPGFYWIIIDQFSHCKMG